MCIPTPGAELKKDDKRWVYSMPRHDPVRACCDKHRRGAAWPSYLSPSSNATSTPLRTGSGRRASTRRPTKDYIFGLLFLKRCSDVFEAEHERIIGRRVERGMALGPLGEVE
jgi:hypothetical protein